MCNTTLPPYMRRSPRLEEALPIPYLRGLSTGDFSEAAGFSATTITRLLKVWQAEYQAWRKRSLTGKEYIPCLSISPHTMRRRP